MSVLIGVDAGGTKTAVIVASEGRVLARAVGPPGAVRAGRALQAGRRVSAAEPRCLGSSPQGRGDLTVRPGGGAREAPRAVAVRRGDGHVPQPLRRRTAT